MKLFYTPFAIVAGVVGHRTGRTAFEAVWSRVGAEEIPPSPLTGRVSLVQLAGSHALEAATIAAVAAVTDQLVARIFHHLFGAWPENPRVPAPPEPAAELSEPAA
jgi:hypothetical protein